MNEIYEVFFKGATSNKEIFLKRVELLKLSNKDFKELLELLNPAYVKLLALKEEDYKAKPKTRAKTAK